MQHVLTDESWAAWRANNPVKVALYENVVSVLSDLRSPNGGNA